MFELIVVNLKKITRLQSVTSSGLKSCCVHNHGSVQRTEKSFIIVVHTNGGMVLRDQLSVTLNSITILQCMDIRD